MMQTKAVAAFAVKSTDADTRTFEGLASTWDLDLGGDVIHKGAFKRTLSHWRQSNRVIPLIDQHNYSSVRSVLGKMIDAQETDDGLWTKWRVVDGEDGDALLHRLRGGMVNGLSIGYETVKSEPETVNGRTIRHLKEVKLGEVSAVIWGMNPNALIAQNSVKSFVASLSDEDRAELRALLTGKSEQSAPEPEQQPDPEEEVEADEPEETEAEDEPAELAPDDPKRLAAEATYRDIMLRSLGTAA